MSRVEQVFTATAASYDDQRTRLIPGFSEFYAAAVALLPPETTRVLDLGAGTGLFSARVREHLPSSELTLVDSSQAMLQQAGTRFDSDTRVQYSLADYSVEELGGPYDAVVSALSIHHLTDEAKQRLFARVGSALRPGGVFVNAEQVLQPTPELESAAREQWLADVCALGATEQQIADSLLRQTEDRCATIDDQLQWLKQAGFADVRCVFAQGRFAVLYGQRPTAAL